ncbi:MAG: TIGR02594 family protein [Polaribacter sp.]|uniref:C40 family peptidase n=1 Tax=Polaribacter sp. TaxID=1920175 RepID=UPI002F359C90
MKNLLNVAINEIGVKEIAGSRDSKRILEYAKESGFPWVNNDETPWCSIFINWVAKKAGLKRSGFASARSWLNVGESINSPEPGDIVVYYRNDINSWEGHVGIFLGYSENAERIYTLGGNQENSVSISAYSAEKLLGFRRLNPSRKPILPKPILKRGVKGVEVEKLQNILKFFGYKTGTSDGDFGPKTEKALILLQSTEFCREATGIYDLKTKKYINLLLEKKG